MEKTNLWHEKTPLAISLINALYTLPNCACGGIAHVLIDDENVRDCDLEWMMTKLIYDGEYSEKIERDLVELICKELVQMTYEQRLAIFEIMMLDIDNEELYKRYKKRIFESVKQQIEDFPNQ